MISATSILGLIFVLALFIYWTLAFLVLYHLIRFGVSGQPKKIAFIFLAGSLVLSLITVLFFYQINPSQIKSFTELNFFQIN